MTPSTPKTFIHMARVAPVGVVLYRRSHLTTYVLLLKFKETATGYIDKLIKGSRFCGRLFPERCDVSPDGKLFAYFAMMGKMTNGKPGPETWSAVCTPPWLKAHVFAPNGSTWGWGGIFLPGKRLVMFDRNPEIRDRNGLKPYKLIGDTSILPEDEKAYLALTVKPQEVKYCYSPRDPKGTRYPHLLRHRKPHVASGYDMYDYVLRNPDGTDFAGAENTIIANWAGWDCDGRLLVANGRHIHIYQVKPGKKLGPPNKTLDLEGAIASND